LIGIQVTQPLGTTPQQTLTIDLSSTPVFVTISGVAQTIAAGNIEWKIATGVEYSVSPGTLSESISRGILTFTLPTGAASQEVDITWSFRVFF